MDSAGFSVFLHMILFLKLHCRQKRAGYCSYISGDVVEHGHRGSGCTVKGSTHPLCLFRVISKASTQSQLFSSIPYSYIQGIPIPQVQCYVKAFLSRDMHMNTQHVKDCMLLNRLVCRNGVRNFVVEGGTGFGRPVTTSDDCMKHVSNLPSNLPFLWSKRCYANTSPRCV